MTEPARISHQDLLPLPRWARLALALRCVRRARGLLQAPERQSRILDQALACLDRAVRTGSAGDELADAAASAYTLALDNLDTPTSDEDVEVVTCMVAHATAFAAEAALAEGRPAARLVGQALDFAIHAYRLADPAGTSEALAAMRADLVRLGQEARAGGWTDQTPVPGE
jgi:hypothetical protein